MNLWDLADRRNLPLGARQVVEYEVASYIHTASSLRYVSGFEGMNRTISIFIISRMTNLLLFFSYVALFCMPLLTASMSCAKPSWQLAAWVVPVQPQ